EVDSPRVGAGEADLRQLVLHARQQPRVVAAAALAVLPAVGVPAVRRERATPAVGLLMAAREECLDALRPGQPLPRTMQVNERRQGATGARRPDRQDLD